MPAPPSPPPAAAADEAAAQPQGSLDALPDGLLAHIMALAGKEHGRSMSLVSHRWRRLFFVETGLWRSFQPRLYHPEGTAVEWAQQVERLAALLQLMAPQLLRFCWRASGAVNPAANADLARCLSALRSDTLAELYLSNFYCTLEGAGSALLGLSSITSLELRGCPEQAVSTAVGALGSRLRSLSLYLRSLEPAMLDSIARFTKLTALSLEARCWPEVLGPLNGLPCLKQLVLLDDGYMHMHMPTMQPPSPAELPASLERFSFEAEHRSFEVAGCDLFKFELWQGRALGYDWDESEPYNLPLPSLAIGGYSAMQALPLLLSALQPAGAAPRPFQRLELERFFADPTAVAGCTQLRLLQELSLRDVRPEDFGADAALEPGLAALLDQTTQLRSLAILPSPGIRLDAVPACLARYRGLTSLAVIGHLLSELPAGEYLTGLQELDLSHNNFSALPPALSAATALTRLALNENSELSLAEADASVLLALRRLQQLEMEGIASAEPALLHDLQQHSPFLAIVPAPYGPAPAPHPEEPA